MSKYISFSINHNRNQLIPSTITPTLKTEEKDARSFTQLDRSLDL